MEQTIYPQWLWRQTIEEAPGGALRMKKRTDHVDTKALKPDKK